MKPMVIKRKPVILSLIIVLLFSLVTEVSASRWTSQYQPDVVNNGWLLERMNCYGYAMQLYYQGTLSSEEYYSYKQQPGEFAYNTETFNNLRISYGNAFSYWKNIDAFVPDRMREDFNTLGYSMTEVVNSDQATGSKRKIALTWGYFLDWQGNPTGDYHFYFQHDDGTWSHKPGETQVSNLSIDTGTVLTNANIASKGKEGYYTSGIKFFEITKDVVVDHPHNNGHGSNTYAPTAFLDRAGDNVDKATYLSSTMYAKLDYEADTDYYQIIPTTTKNYTISTSGNGIDLDGTVISSSGTLIAADNSTANFNVNVQLQAYQTYYVRIYDFNDTNNNYTISFY